MCMGILSHIHVYNILKVCMNLYSLIHVGENFFIAKISHPPYKCGTSIFFSASFLIPAFYYICYHYTRALLCILLLFYTSGSKLYCICFLNTSALCSDSDSRINCPFTTQDCITTHKVYATYKKTFKKTKVINK